MATQPSDKEAHDGESTSNQRPRPWQTTDPSRLIGRGHPAGDFLEAYRWRLEEERLGYLRLLAHVPDRVRNPRGQLFGGFTPTYVDLVALFTVRAGEDRSQWSGWLATTNMRIDYFAPVLGPDFRIESQLVHNQSRLRFVETQFFDLEGALLVFALTTMRALAQARPLGDA